MTKFQAGVTSIVVAGLLTAVILQQDGIAHLNEQHDRLRVQVDQATQLAADRQWVASQPVPAEPTLPNDEYLELLKLRGAVGVQRDQLEKLKSELATRENSATARALRAPVTTNYFPKSAWAVAGNATPEAALQSITWQMQHVTSHNDLAAILALLPAEAQAAAAKDFAGKSDAQIDAELAEEAAHTTNVVGMRILYQQNVSPDEVVFTYYNDGQDGFGRLPLQRSGNGWQIGNFPVDP